MSEMCPYCDEYSKPPQWIAEVAALRAERDAARVERDRLDELMRLALGDNETLRADIAALREERDAAVKELERERMRLAACGVVALSDTPESAALNRDMLPEYRSASCDDVARRVDECMALRAEVDRLRAEAAGYTAGAEAMREAVAEVLKSHAEQLREAAERTGTDVELHSFISGKVGALEVALLAIRALPLPEEPK